MHSIWNLIFFCTHLAFVVIVAIIQFIFDIITGIFLFFPRLFFWGK